MCCSILCGGRIRAWGIYVGGCMWLIQPVGGGALWRNIFVTFA